MNAQELLKSGKPGEALASLQQEVRGNAADPKLRVFLFQLLCVLGQWDRALTQLAVLADMGSEEQMLSRIFEPVVATRDFKGAASLRDRAMEEAPAVSGQVDGSAFEWIMDADPRLGPMMEAIIEGTYYWVPFMRVKRVIIEAPTDLRDLVWAPAHFLWVNGGEVFGHVPVRYPGSEKHTDGPIQLARKTEWVEQPSGYSLGLGHRLLSTDTTDLPLLECRTIEMNLESPALDLSAKESASNPNSHG